MLTTHTQDLIIYVALILFVTVDFWPVIQRWIKEQ